MLSKKPAENLFETKEAENVQLEEVIDETDKNQDEDYFCLVRSSFVENLTDIEAVENSVLEETDSTDTLDISTSES